MALTPIDVQQKTFATALRGYDLDEVDDFLDSVVLALKDYDQRLRDAQERIAALESELSDQGDAEGAIARALVAAQRSADSIVADAKEEAQQIVADAHSEATELAEERDAERVRLENEIAEIRSRIDTVRSGVSELAALLPSQLDDMEQILDDAEPAPAAVGATFDAAEPVPGYEDPADDDFGSMDDVDEVDESIDVDDDESWGDTVDLSDDADFDDGSSEPDDVDETDEDDEAASMPDLGAITERIDAAFGDDVSQLSEGATRPWET